VAGINHGWHVLNVYELLAELTNESQDTFHEGRARSLAGDGEEFRAEIASMGMVNGGVRFDDLEPAEMVAFLDKARRHSELDPSSADLGKKWADIAHVWSCDRCGSEHPIDDIIVVKGEPRCPHCGAEGWRYVVPRALE
jgi:DNA-directed RNA polymerase subunit RPC12/RpoP